LAFAGYEWIQSGDPGHAVPHPARLGARRQVEEELTRYRREVLDCVKVRNAYPFDWGMLVIDELFEPQG
jgi:hypothetical protein